MNVGTGWTANASSFTIQSNKAQGPTNNVAIYTTNSTQSDVVITCDLTLNTGTSDGIILRFTDILNYWIVFVDVPNTLFKITEVVAGAGTVRASSSIALIPGQTKSLSVTASGSSITAVLGGTTTISYNSAATDLSATYHGLYCVGTVSNTGTFDNFLVTSIAVVIPPLPITQANPDYYPNDPTTIQQAGPGFHAVFPVWPTTVRFPQVVELIPPSPQPQVLQGPRVQSLAHVSPAPMVRQPYPDSLMGPWWESQNILPVVSRGNNPTPARINPLPARIQVPDPSIPIHNPKVIVLWVMPPPPRTTFLQGESGRYRVQNLSLEGYVVYIGVNALPDLLNGTPAGFSATLPVSVPITPPVTGSEVLYVVVRYRDSYGLVSQNQKHTIFQVNSSGNLVMNPVPPPTAVQAYPGSLQTMRVLARYMTVATDANPADRWYVWLNTVQPLITDAPTYMGVVVNDVFQVEFGMLSPGTYYMMIALYRSADGSSSTPVTLQVVMPAQLPAPGSVHGGGEIPL